MSEPNQAVIKVSTGGVFNDVEILARAIKALGEKHNLVVPGGAIGAQMPAMYAAGLSFVFVDPDNETYAIPGKSERGIGKMALDRIAAAAGVRWNPHLCGRVDDNSSPNVVEYQVAGTVQQLDGTERMITASKRIDLRAERNTPIEGWGSDAQEFQRNAEKNGNDPWPRILQARQHILSLAETKAKNRAIRSLGVRTAYSPADLAKGFVVLKLQFTGQSDDPEVAREVQLMIARRALTSSAELYGGEARRQMAAAPLSKPVPKIAVKEAETEEEDDSRPDPAAEPAKSATPPPAPEAKPKDEAPVPASPKDDPMLICGAKNAATNKWPRKPCSEFTIDELRKKIENAEKNQHNWDPQYVDKNTAELKAMKAWLAFKEFDPRQGTLPGTEGSPDQVAF